MTALADLLSPRDRDRLAARLGELRDLAALMRQRGTAPRPPPPPPALHKMAAKDTNGRTTR